MRLVVIGGVAAGLSAAARTRRLDPAAEIVVLEKGTVISYAACGLPYFLQGKMWSASELIVHTPDHFRQERKIDVRTGAEAIAIAHGRREVVLRSGERVRYDRLVVATGARADRSLASGDAERVFTLQTLDDGERLKRFLADKRPRTAGVVGGGYIGLEAADALRTNGLRVTVTSASPYLLEREDPTLTAMLVKHLERHRVEVRLGTRVRSVDEVAGDLVLLAAGMMPNVEMAQEAGIECGRAGAIRTDERMETSLGGVYAAGDCCETTHLVSGRPVWMPLGTTANKMGRVAGANIAGRRERFPGVVGTSIVKICGLGIGMTGLSEAAARRDGFRPIVARIETRDRPKYFFGRPCTVELVADRGSRRLLGGWVTGEHGVEGRVNVIATALAGKLTVEEFEGLDLAYAPPFAPVWDPLLVCAQQLLRQL